MTEKEIYLKTVLRNIGSHNIEHYLTPVEIRRQLNYPQSCTREGEIMVSSTTLVGISFSYNKENRMKWEIALCNSNYETIFVQAVEQVRDHELKSKIQDLLEGKILVGYDMGLLLRKINLRHDRFIDLVHLCPHGLGLPNKLKLEALSMQVLNIPLTNPSNSRRGRGYRGYYRQYRRQPNPYEGLLNDSDQEERRGRGRGRRKSRDRDEMGSSSELHYMINRAVVTIKIAEKYIANGSGVVTSVSSQKRVFANHTQMLEQAQLGNEIICGLYLRGSRSIGIEIDSSQYKSDWDYICVLETKAVLNSILVKLHDVDLILMDKRTATIFLNGNDMPMVELFYLPPECVLINKLQRPFIDITSLKKSLVYHLRKVDEKVEYYSQEFFKHHMHPNRNYSEVKEISSKWKKQQKKNDRREVADDWGQRRRGNRQEKKTVQHPLLQKVYSRISASQGSDPNFLKWKFMKAMHLQIRFLDEFLQFQQNNCIRDIKRTVPFWKKLCEICQNSGFLQGFKVCNKQIFRLLNKAFSSFELQYLQLKFYKMNNKQPEHSRYGYNPFYYPVGRRGQYHIPLVAKRMLSMYRYTAVQSRPGGPGGREGDGKIVQRFHDINDDRPQFFYRSYESGYGQHQSQYNLVILKESSIKRPTLQIEKFFKDHDRIGQKQEGHLFSTYFLKIGNYFEVKYVQKYKEEEKDQLFCLSNFFLKENADEKDLLVQQAKSSIYKSHVTRLQTQLTVKTLVCLKYTHFYQYKKGVENHLQGKFDFNDFSIFEKKDGVLAVLYFVGSGWVVSSKQTPDGNEIIYDDITFSNEFLRVFNLLDYKLPNKEDESRVFLFQLLSTKISNVLLKQKDELILHGVRNMEDLQEEDPQVFSAVYGWKFAEKLDIQAKSLEQITDVAENRINFQGFILRDGNFNRIIIRNSQFLKRKWKNDLQTLLAQPIDFFVEKNIDNNRRVYFIYSQIIMKNKYNEYLKAFPQDSKIIHTILKYLKQVNEECEALRTATKGLSQQSEAMNEIIADKRIDVLNYLFGSCNQAFPQRFANRNEASIDFVHAFNFILQELNYSQMKDRLLV